MRTRDRRVRAERGFYALRAPAMARRLLGCRLVRVLDGERVSGIIVETEAYCGTADRASHAFNGRRTERTEPMFAKPGTSYVYFTYGMHHCMNVSCYAEGVPDAVLIRAIEPEEGLEAMCARRKTEKVRDLCRGPARLCAALGIDRTMNAADMCERGTMWIEPGEPMKPRAVVRTARVGIRSAGEWTERPLRFCVRGSVFVSGPTMG